jgi:hypothetical protein
MAWRVANEGYEPKDEQIRIRLGFRRRVTVELPPGAILVIKEK